MQRNAGKKTSKSTSKRRGQKSKNKKDDAPYSYLSDISSENVTNSLPNRSEIQNAVVDVQAIEDESSNDVLDQPPPPQTMSPLPANPSIPEPLAQPHGFVKQNAKMPKVLVC